MADPIDKDDLVRDIVQMIDKLISDYKKSYVIFELTLVLFFLSTMQYSTIIYYRKNISKRSKWLLKKVALAACFLTREEIARAVKYVLSDDEKLADNIILSIYGKLPCIQELKDASRKTLVLIIDEVNKISCLL